MIMLADVMKATVAVRNRLSEAGSRYRGKPMTGQGKAHEYPAETKRSAS